MELRPLGTTGISLFPVTLGCGTFGGIGSPAHLVGRGLDEAAARAAMDEAVALGVNLFDTACSYAGGASERFIGRWLADQSPERRESVRLATKVGIVATAEGMTVDLSRSNIGRQFAGSLERLGAERVDFCLSHAPDTATPTEETLEALADLIESGQILHIGACNLSSDQLEEALLASERLGLPRYEWLQNEYNLLRRGDEADLFALCREHGLSLTPFSPLAGGVLSGKYERDQAPPKGSRLALRPEGQSLQPALFDALDRLAARATERGVSAGALALAWVMSQPLVCSLIAGPARTAEHLGLARAALGVTLTAAERDEIAGWFSALA